MTEVEISRLLQELTEVAGVLNRQSDSINELIEGFENRLRKLNLGLEVWLTDALESRPWAHTTDGETSDEGTNDVQLGFVAGPGRPAPLRAKEWHLAIRTVTWRRRPDDRGWDLIEVEPPSTRLLDASREIRIAALSRFPQLLGELNRAAKQAVQAIQDAKKFVQ